MSPGQLLRHHLAACGWDQVTLALVLGRPAQFVSELANDKKRVTARTALDLADAFGTDPMDWLRADTEYRLALAAIRMPPSVLEAIRQRAAYFDARLAEGRRFPLKAAADALESLLRRGRR